MSHGCHSRGYTQLQYSGALCVRVANSYLVLLTPWSSAGGCHGSGPIHNPKCSWDALHSSVYRLGLFTNIISFYYQTQVRQVYKKKPKNLPLHHIRSWFLIGAQLRPILVYAKPSICTSHAMRHKMYDCYCQGQRICIKTSILRAILHGSTVQNNLILAD